MQDRNEMPTISIFIRLRNPNGKTEVLEARCWHAEHWLEAARSRYRARGITVDVITEAEYTAEKENAMVGVGADRGPRLHYR